MNTYAQYLDSTEDLVTPCMCSACHQVFVPGHNTKYCPVCGIKFDGGMRENIRQHREPKWEFKLRLMGKELPAKDWTGEKRIGYGIQRSPDGIDWTLEKGCWYLFEHRQQMLADWKRCLSHSFKDWHYRIVATECNHQSYSVIPINTKVKVLVHKIVESNTILENLGH